MPFSCSMKLQTVVSFNTLIGGYCRIGDLGYELRVETNNGQAGNPARCVYLYAFDRGFMYTHGNCLLKCSLGGWFLIQ